jgi:alkyldihydroxyacetonephosphate synthase
MKNGGCISHHHGVGKLRKKFMNNSIGEVGLNVLRGVKKTVDPKNTFATGNLI